MTTKRFAEERDITNKLIGSIVFSPKREDYFFVQRYEGGGLVKTFTFTQETGKKTWCMLNVEDEEDVSLQSLIPGFINRDYMSSYWTRNARKSWCYGYHKNHSFVLLGPEAMGSVFVDFNNSVLTPEGFASFRNDYPSLEEALWVAERDECAIFRAFSKNMAWAKTKRGVALFVDGASVGYLRKDRKSLIVKRKIKRVPETLFKKIFASLFASDSLPKEVEVKNSAKRLEGDEPDIDEWNRVLNHALHIDLNLDELLELRHDR